MNGEHGSDSFLESARRHQTPDELAAAQTLAAGVKALLARLEDRLSDDVQPDSFRPDRTRGG